MLNRIANKVLLLWGWQRAALACAAGAASALAMAPFHFWPILFITFPILIWLIDGASAGKRGRIVSAAVTGWWFGFGYFVAGLYWLGIAFLVDAHTFAWLMPLAVVGLPAGLAFFTALGTAISGAFWIGGPGRILIFVAAMTFVEYLRGTILSGFPWNAFGYALGAPLALAQSFSLVGLWGMTLIALAVFSSPAALSDETKRRWVPLAISIVVLIAMTAFGFWRLESHPTEFVEGPKLRLMQPNLPQDVKFNYGAKADVMKRYLDISQRTPSSDKPNLYGVTHLVWPESAFPFLLTREPDALAQIAELLPQGTMLITGAARLAPQVAGRLQAYNSIYTIADDGSIVETYDKVHLVPFGEYLPVQSLLESIGLQQLTKVRGGFTSGQSRALLTIAGLPPAVPLICYEVIFPAAITAPGERPGFMLNLTNDGWFGNSTGPYQHFHQARMRAIEEGLPLVRSANTGISAFVDGYGRTTASLPLGAEGSLDGALPKVITAPPFAQWGNTLPLFLWLVWLAFSVAAWWAARVTKTNAGLRFQPQAL
ncbi:apolipoprotein N-acyltransferase [Variibacter gotjawalensis]|uniref:Apolipoprotein N-acyltransferase n=1 Tax=Variibacter gotjawalensis TaxID=1333996 RepID=A0A0S3PQ21_9BRAD|nr:apolipoprotein N-acyltransferase [Variibacter gotjawalensis]NIK48339.1 apolipoprotein N-acyltransferase [Variibacter gotjawalensis]RZS50209.1 apolipoprotein N-acyltransferase [Variibacter gotjawalensis]BAT58040.1 apolipoprotein N-acyltransferase [Variibacter gotjawalensis]